MASTERATTYASVLARHRTQKQALQKGKDLRREARVTKAIKAAKARVALLVLAAGMSIVFLLGLYSSYSPPAPRGCAVDATRGEGTRLLKTSGHPVHSGDCDAVADDQPGTENPFAGLPDEVVGRDFEAGDFSEYEA
jgi:hypothetical protein